jgi:hypothetical protein
MQNEIGQGESARAIKSGSNAVSDLPPQSRVWLDINYEELDQFTSPNLICQYCFRPIGLDRSIEALIAELRRKPLLLSTSTHESII